VSGIPIEVNAIRDWTPLVDAKQVASVHVLRGENFLITERGVRSAFASAQITCGDYATLLSSSAFNFQAFKVGSRWFLFCDAGVYEYIPSSNTYTMLYAFPTPCWRAFKWTMAYVGKHHYFAHESVGCVRYSTELDVWEFVSSKFVCVTAAQNRLVAITKTAFMWSAVDDGINFDPSLITGAGAQSLLVLGVVGVLDVLGVETTATGVYTFTTQGVLYSRYQQGGVIFNHMALTTQTYPLNSFALVNEESLGLVVLSANGFYTFKDGGTQAWQPVMSLYFRRYVLPNTHDAGAVRLFWSHETQLLYMSYGYTGDLHYTKAFVLSVAVDQWGHFDKKHKAFSQVGKNTLWFADGNLHQMTGGDFDYTLPSSSVWERNTLPESGVVLGASSVPADKKSLVSWVTVGGLRLASLTSEPVAHDATTVLRSIVAHAEAMFTSVFDEVEDLAISGVVGDAVSYTRLGLTGGVANAFAWRGEGGSALGASEVVDLMAQQFGSVVDLYPEVEEEKPLPVVAAEGTATLTALDARSYEANPELMERRHTAAIYSTRCGGVYVSLTFKCLAAGAKLKINMLSLSAFFGGRTY